MCPSASVGRMPIITWCAPTFAALSSASLSERRRLSSKVESPPSRSLAGARLISMLNCQLGLEVGVGDRLEDLGVLEGGVARVVDEVELHLQARHRVVGVEACLAE